MTPADQMSDAGTTLELSTSGAMNLAPPAQPAQSTHCTLATHDYEHTFINERTLVGVR